MSFVDKDLVIDSDLDRPEMWETYLDVHTNYELIKQAICCDDIILNCVKEYYGIRLLRQDPWEVLVSFIISINNNIPRIKKIVEKFCECFGEKIAGGYAFPRASVVSDLKVEDLGCIAAGFRGKYILDAAKKITDGEISLKGLAEFPTLVIKDELMKIQGVGPKVADCVLLFGFGRRDVFPKDVWIKRILREIYSVDENFIDDFAEMKFGNLRGFAQQYLFHYYRSKKLCTN